MKRYNPRTFKPDGVYVGMPMSDYVAAPGLSASRLKVLLESPLTFKRERDGLLKRESTAAMQIGTALHSAILENELNYHVRPDTYGDGKKWNSNANECKEWIEAHKDKPILSLDDAHLVDVSRRYVRNHPKVKNFGLLKGGKAEVSVFATINGRQFKGRFDYYNAKTGIITDLKSVADASSRGLLNSILKYGWHLQAALYQSLAFAATGTKPDFYWIALEKGQLPLVNVRKFGLSATMLGETALARALDILTDCEETGVWPEYADDMGDEIKSLEVPEWALTEQDISNGTLTPDEL